jgi:hypothetical protein
MFGIHPKKPVPPLILIRPLIILNKKPSLLSIESKKISEKAQKSLITTDYEMITQIGPACPAYRRQAQAGVHRT